MRPSCKAVGFPAALAALALLAGCADALTVHSIVPDDDPVPDVPVIAGTWKRALPDGQATITFDGVADDVGQCREGKGRYQSAENDFAATQVCFVEINGYLLAEVASETQSPGFQRQFLVRFDGDDRFEVCGELTLWLLLRNLAEEHAVGYSLDSLQHTTREDGYFVLMVFIAQRKEMREFLASALPELAAACDGGTTTLTAWVPYDRVPEDDGPSDDLASE